MKHFVHLKDDVVFAYHESSVEEDIPGDNIIEVDHEGINYLKKKYVNGQFVDAPEIRYAKLDSNNTVVKIDSTVFSSDVPESAKVIGSEVDILWKWNGTSFIAPNSPTPIETIDFGSVQVTTSEDIPAMTAEEIGRAHV